LTRWNDERLTGRSVAQPRQFGLDKSTFVAWFTASPFEPSGFNWAQANDIDPATL
jgi:hypothetical protein